MIDNIGCMFVCLFFIFFFIIIFATEILECASDPCLNDATCVEQVNGYECQCPAGFVGTNCETGNQTFFLFFPFFCHPAFCLSFCLQLSFLDNVSSFPFIFFLFSSIAFFFFFVHPF